MDWVAKFDAVVASLETDVSIEQDFFVKEHGAKESFLNKLESDYPFVPDDYVRFLRMTDGATIAQCRFLGSANFDSLAPLHSDTYPKNDWLLIGLDPGGDPLLLHKTRKVAIGEGKSSSGNFEVLASNFGEFLCDVLMGQRFASVFRVRDDHQRFYEGEIDQDPWIAYLVKQGWIKII